MDKVGAQHTTPRAFGFHIFRHTPGSEFTEATRNLKKTQSFLGHSSIKTTADVYAHLQPDAELDAMHTLEEVIFSRIVLNCSQLGSNGGRLN